MTPEDEGEGLFGQILNYRWCSFHMNKAGAANETKSSEEQAIKVKKAPLNEKRQRSGEASLHVVVTSFIWLQRLTSSSLGAAHFSQLIETCCYYITCLFISRFVLFRLCSCCASIPTTVSPLPVHCSTSSSISTPSVPSSICSHRSLPILCRANLLIIYELLHLSWQWWQIPTGFNHGSANEISMANAHGSAAPLAVFVPSRQVLHIASRYPGRVGRSRAGWNRKSR